jgi:hypothetical protein
VASELSGVASELSGVMSELSGVASERSGMTPEASDRASPHSGTRTSGFHGGRSKKGGVIRQWRPISISSSASSTN